MTGTYTLILGARGAWLFRDGNPVAPEDARRILDDAGELLRDQAAGGVIAPPADAGPPLPEGPADDEAPEWQKARPA